ncbi:menaquinone biosynthesis decarboxylase [Candidatus Poribacteria bacterium]|jgi:4-hydroxy-3-polyprenylbenzoate decarboxylase|nr:menaquinone biosynthesis decarboxylase [Candidatus Poribacteria bacterium]MBT5712069.1 menaquinone biosynthesis decarboxylase [Candidatus Poribacteria bacterium]MBT7803977.1 menaquinone biosynthesis decarboxylase [Candidatus Poribacteria bacterium]
MAYRNLREFVDDLDAAGSLKRVTAPVSPYLEITEIADRVTKAEGPALLFENVEGSDVPLLINAYGSYDRMARSLGVEDIEEIAAEIDDMIKLAPPQTFMEKMRTAATLAKVARFPPKTVRSGPCQDVVLQRDDVDLLRFPIITCWPEDAGPYITFGQVLTKSLGSGARNVGLYRVQVFDKDTAAMHWHMHHDGARHYREYCDAGERMPIAVAIGGDPVLPYAATAPLPPSIDELLFAGFLRKDHVPLVTAATLTKDNGYAVDIEVPAEADIVIEGYLEPNELVTEGPFGDHTGFYSLADEYPKFHITAITHRRDPIYHTIIVGKPPQEDYYLGKATERIFLPLLRTQLPEVVDMNLPIFGVFHNFVFVSIDKQYPWHAKKVMSAIWGTGQMMFSKIIVVVDAHVNVQDTDEVWFHVGSNVDPRRDVSFTDGPVDILDHASPMLGIGSKMGIDATKKWETEGFDREWPTEIVMTDEVREKVDKRWREYGLG